jgi:hypothetical protein
MSSGLRLALLTLNLSQNDFNRMDRDNLKKYIENFFKQEYVQKDFEKYKIAAKLVLENKPKVEEENIYDDVQEENGIDKKHYTQNNSLVNPFFHNSFFNPFSMFNTNFSNMMNEIDNLHRNFDNFNMEDNFSKSYMRNSSSTNMMNGYNGTNGFTKSYSRTYVNNNGTGYIKEESMKNDGKGKPKVKSFYRKIENGRYVEEPDRSSQKMIEQ